MSTLDGEISHWRDALGARNDAHLAEMLGYSRSNINVWKRRGSIPNAARSRAEALMAELARVNAADQRRRELGHQLLYEGQCLALFLAPAVDVAISRRFPAIGYSETLREYASFFNEIVLACAEEVAARLPSIEGNASDAFASLTQDDPHELYRRIMRRAHAWRTGENDE